MSRLMAPTYQPCRHSEMKKVNKCSDGGIAKFRRIVLEGNQPSCKACQALLEMTSFKQTELNQCVQDALNGDAGDASKESPEKSKKKKTKKSKCGKRRAWRKKKARDVSSCESERHDVEADALALAATFQPDIILLPRGTNKKLVPYQCLLCKSRAQPEGKIGECSQLKPTQIKFYLTKHVNSNMHQANLARREREVAAESRKQKVACEAISMGSPVEGSALHLHKTEFDLWMSYANLEATATHIYTKDADSNWIIRSSHCEQEVLVAAEASADSQERPCCKTCLKLCEGKGIVRAALRFAKKFWASQLLHARVFADEETISKCKKQVMETTLFKRGDSTLTQLLDMNLASLQEWVRKSWLCEHSTSDTLKLYVETVVRPALRVNVSQVSPGLQDLVCRIGMHMASGKASQHELAELKLASSALHGSLRDHPIIMGLALQCRRQLDKKQRGVTTMCGRRDRHETAVEEDLIRDAGLQLAIHAANTALIREFGLNSRDCRVRLPDLEMNNLPQPALALLWPDVMEQNGISIDQKYVRAAGAPKRLSISSGFGDGGFRWFPGVSGCC